MERSLSALLPVHNVQSSLANTVHEHLEILPELTPFFEVVLVDDGSTDSTIEVADELATRYPQIVVSRHAQRRGRIAAIRTGLERSSGSVLLLQDDDSDLVLDDLHRLWHAAEMHEVVLGTGPASTGAFQWGGDNPSSRAGIQMVSRAVAGRIVEALVDQVTLRNLLAQSGLCWHEIELSRRTGGMTPARRPFFPLGKGAAARTDPPAVSHQGPKRPNYLAKLRDFALGE